MKIILPLCLIICAVLAAAAPTLACDQPLLDHRPLQPAMSRYFAKLTRTPWEGVYPFGRLEGKRIYMSPAFDRLEARQKKSVLSLLLLEYGDYVSLLPLLPSPQRQAVENSSGAMVPYEVYSADGRLVSLPYNGCRRLTLLTEYERSRIGFLGLTRGRIQRYPMSNWQQERIKKLFWQSVGYKRAGAYWIAWVPESGHFEIDVPSLNHSHILGRFWQQAPDYYNYVIVDRGQRLYSVVSGHKRRP